MRGRTGNSSIGATNPGCFGGGESGTRFGGTGRADSGGCYRLAIRALTGGLLGDCGLMLRLWSGTLVDPLH